MVLVIPRDPTGKRTEEGMMMLIDPVDTGLTPTSVRILESLLSKFLRNQRKEEGSQRRFDLLIRPLFDQLQVVHLDYSQILRKVRRELLRTGDMDPAAGLAAAEAAVEALEHDRTRQEGVRDRLRTNAGGMLSALKDKMERRFVYAIIVYFQENDHRPFLADSVIDAKVDIIVEDGGRTAMSTPTTVLLGELRGRLSEWRDGSRERDEIVMDMESRVDNAISKLNQRLVDVSRQYASFLVS